MLVNVLAGIMFVLLGCLSISFVGGSLFVHLLALFLLLRLLRLLLWLRHGYGCCQCWPFFVEADCVIRNPMCRSFRSRCLFHACVEKPKNMTGSAWIV